MTFETRLLPPEGGLIARCPACGYCWLATLSGMEVARFAEVARAQARFCPACGANGDKTPMTIAPAGGAGLITMVYARESVACIDGQ